MKILITCPCSKDFETTQKRIDTGRGIYCSKPCLYKYRVRPSGLNYNFVADNSGRFESTHGMSNTPTYGSWHAMMSRTNWSSPKDDHWEHYGSRGISVCDEWLKFENFYRDMGDRPEGMTLDRIDNDGNYEPSNCKWSTPTEQAQNRRNRWRVRA